MVRGWTGVAGERERERNRSSLDKQISLLSAVHNRKEQDELSTLGKNINTVIERGGERRGESRDKCGFTGFSPFT